MSRWFLYNVKVMDRGKRGYCVNGGSGRKGREAAALWL